MGISLKCEYQEHFYNMYLFVKRPDLVPLHVHHWPGAPLNEAKKNKKTKRVNINVEKLFADWTILVYI